MTFNIKKYILFLFTFLLMLYTINAFSIDQLDSKVIVRNNGLCEIHDTLKIKNINSNTLTFNIVPVYDLIVKVDGRDINYNNSSNTLYINLKDVNKNKLNLDIVYLTDYFTTKQSGEWDINYFSIFKENIDNLIFQLPENTEIKDMSVDLEYIAIVDNKFVLELNNLDYLNIKYNINPKKLKSEKTNYKFLLWLFFIIIIIVLMILKLLIYFKKKKLNNNKENKIKELLLGLNENEQKIIKFLLEKEGVSQKTLSLKLFLPKGTVSRNIKNLESKEYVVIKSYGVTHKVFLSKIFDKYKSKNIK